MKIVIKGKGREVVAGNEAVRAAGSEYWSRTYFFSSDIETGLYIDGVRYIFADGDYYSTAKYATVKEILDAWYKKCDPDLDRFVPVTERRYDFYHDIILWDLTIYEEKEAEFAFEFEVPDLDTVRFMEDGRPGVMYYDYFDEPGCCAYRCDTLRYYDYEIEGRRIL